MDARHPNIERPKFEQMKTAVTSENILNDVVLGLSKKLEAHEVEGSRKRDSVDLGRGQSRWITDRRVTKVSCSDGNGGSQGGSSVKSLRGGAKRNEEEKQLGNTRNGEWDGEEELDTYNAKKLRETRRRCGRHE
ncbi:hypothetical protein ACSQ67_024805 [Phaseolus vulgaris]